MSTPVKSTAPVVSKLASALQGFLVMNSLPDPAVVSFTVVGAGRIDIQPSVIAYTDPVAVLSSLLLWARGLTAVTATWTHTADRDESYLHVQIDGRLLSGVRVHLYKSVPYDTVREWVLLDLDQKDSVSLDELAWLVGELHSARPAA